MKNIIIFASGNGSNAQNIINYFKKDKIKVSLIVTDNKNAKVLGIAEKELITSIVISNDTLFQEEFINYLKSFDPCLIVLAGFLKKIPVNITKSFKIVNIHPSLLPKYGGKGMYGDNIHKIVINNKEKLSGVTIHYVNENYDEGKIILQIPCNIKETDDYSTLSNKIRRLEHLYYPKVIRNIVNKFNT